MFIQEKGFRKGEKKSFKKLMKLIYKMKLYNEGKRKELNKKIHRKVLFHFILTNYELIQCLGGINNG